MLWGRYDHTDPEIEKLEFAQKVAASLLLAKGFSEDEIAETLMQTFENLSRKKAENIIKYVKEKPDRSDC